MKLERLAEVTEQLFDACHKLEAVSVTARFASVANDEDVKVTKDGEITVQKQPKTNR